MTTKVVYICDGPNCANETQNKVYNKWIFVEISEFRNTETIDRPLTKDFCSFSCLAEYANTK